MAEVEAVQKFIRTHVKKENLIKLESDLKKNFVLERRKIKKTVNHKRTKKSKLMTRKEKKELGLYHVPIKSLKYVNVLPLNRLWNSYMIQQLDLEDRKVPSINEKSWENFSLAAYKADYHGALITVTKSKCPSMVNITGICIMETKNTFKILSKDNIVRLIPKEGSAFTFHLDEFDFMIYGKHIAKKPAERSVKISKLFSLAEI